MDRRTLRALELAATMRLEPTNGRWLVPSQSGKGRYVVTVGENGFRCTCEDWLERREDCKHCLAIQFSIRRENSGEPLSFGELVPRSQHRDWKSYTESQKREGDLFPVLLADLCRFAPQPAYTTGRPPLSMADLAFATVQRAYDRLSVRRFDSAMRAAERRGHVDSAPSIQSIWRYIRTEGLTAVLQRLTTVSALALEPYEDYVAPDATGFGVPQMEPWFDAKQGRERTRRVYVKLHAFTGTKTCIVMAAVVTPRWKADTSHLQELLDSTDPHFPLAGKTLVADKGYSSRTNAAAVTTLGAKPLIMFRDNTVEPDLGTAWADMWQWFTTDRQAALDEYHRRSNVESAFSGIKARFGAELRGKTFTTQANEVLSKVLAWNICVRIRMHYELGAPLGFEPVEAPAIAS